MIMRWYSDILSMSYKMNRPSWLCVHGMSLCQYDILMCLASLSAHSLPALQLFSQIVLSPPTIPIISETMDQ